MKAEIIPADDDVAARFSGGLQITANWIGRAIRKGRVIAGLGGVMELEDGVWFAFLDIPERYRRPFIFRHIKAVLDEAKAQASEIRAVCDDEIPRAVEMMDRLGFKPTDEEIDGKVVWSWSSEV